MRRVLCVILVTLITILCVGCSSSVGTSTEKLGTRKNPAKLNETVRVKVDSILGKGIIELTMTEIIRGAEAARKMQQASSLNGDAPEGKEFILAKFSVAFIENQSDDDSPLEVSSWQFNYASSTFALNNHFLIMFIENELNLTLCEGASGEGYALLIADKDDAGYAVFQGDTWFTLS